MRLLIIIFAFSMSVTLTAQNYKFGKISKEELEEKFNPMDSSAAATYLYKNRNTFFEYNQEDGFQLITEIHERIKIYTTEGFDYATRQVNLYKDGSTREKLTNLKASTYNFDNGKIENSKLKKDGIFETELSKYYNQTKFTLSNLKIGSVIEYKYKIISPFSQNVDEFQFQHNIPIKKLEARFETPEYFSFKANAKGFLNVFPQTERVKGEITITTRNVTGTGNSAGGSQPNTFSRSTAEYFKDIKTYKLNNVPALQEEPYVDNINNYRSAVKFELSYTQFPNSTINYYTTTWEDVVKTIYKNPSFGAELNKSGYYEKDVKALIGGISDPLKKAALIYNYVKSKIKWNGYNSKYTSGGVRKAYKEQIGNVAEINLMLTSMLRYAGLNANPVLVSTRTNGVPIFPTREGYNYVISAIGFEKGIVLLDATNKYGSPNILPSRALNWKGRIVEKSGNSSLINLYPSKKSKNTVSMSVNLGNEGTVEGVIRTVKIDHAAMNYRQSYVGSDKTEYLERMENRYGGMEISDFKVQNAVDLSKPIMESYKFTQDNQFEVIGNQMYLSPMFFLSIKENPFKSDKREFPINFGYPLSNKYNIIIKVPEGYKVESIPEPKILKLPENMGSFKYNIAVTPQSIQVVVNTEMNNAIISPVYYDVLKEYFKDIIAAENEKIVLIKE